MSSLAEPSAKQRQLLAYLIAFRHQHGFSPTIRELQAHFQLRSPAAIQFHLERLRALDLITWIPGRFRTLLPTPSAHSP